MDKATKPAIRWARFAGCLATILFCAFVVLPTVQRLGPVREVRRAIHRADIDATALFYTESETSAESEAEMRNTMRYSTSRYREVGKSETVAD